MKTKKIPMRTCVISKEKLPKQELLRIVRTPEGKVVIDETGRTNGHVINKARTSKILERIMETKIDDEIYDMLEKKC